MSKHHLQSEGIKALEQSLNDHMEICRLQRKAKRLKAENARLKAEVEAYRSASDEVAAAFLALPTPHNQVARVCEGIESLKAEVERLRKAGDALYESEIGYYGEQILVDPKHHSGELCRNWNAAKEGKQL